MALGNKPLSALKAACAGQRAQNVLRLASAVSDAELVVIGPDTYEFDTAANPGTITAGNIRVNVVAAQTADAAATALVAAINASSTIGIGATKISSNEVLIFSNVSGNFVYACTETLAGSNNVWAAAAMYGGEAKAARKWALVSRAVIAQEITIGNVHFCFPFIPTRVLVQVFSATFVPKATWVGAYTINATTGNVIIDNSGATDFIATDIITVFASE